MDARTPIYIRIREQVCADIVRGRWPLGSHLSLHELADYYKVSPVPVREALFRLHGEGIVFLRVHRGAVVPTVDADYIEGLYEVRGAIQSVLARHTARKAGAADVDRMHAIEQSRVEALDQGDLAACVVANRTLHGVMDDAAALPVGSEILAMRSTLLDALRASRGYTPLRLAAIQREHAALIDAIAARDEDAAAAAALSHVEGSRADLLALLQQPGAVSDVGPTPMRKLHARRYRPAPEDRLRAALDRAVRSSPIPG